MQTIHLLISGRVQGVFFRQHAKDIARQLGLKGYAKNLPNGNVEVVAQGNESKLNELIDFCKKGPELAEVEELKIEDIITDEKFKGFEIIY